MRSLTGIILYKFTKLGFRSDEYAALEKISVLIGQIGDIYMDGSFRLGAVFGEYADIAVILFHDVICRTGGRCRGCCGYGLVSVVKCGGK